MDSAYRRLCGITGGALILLGLLLLVAMLVYLGTGPSPMPVDGVGHYFVAFTGSVLVAWGLSLRAAAQDSKLAHILAPANAIGMAFMAFYRFVIVLSSADVRAWIGFLPMGEAFLFGLLAIISDIVVSGRHRDVYSYLPASPPTWQQYDSIRSSK